MTTDCNWINLIPRPLPSALDALEQRVCTPSRYAAAGLDFARPPSTIEQVPLIPPPDSDPTPTAVPVADEFSFAFDSPVATDPDTNVGYIYDRRESAGGGVTIHWTPLSERQQSQQSCLFVDDVREFLPPQHHQEQETALCSHRVESHKRKSMEEGDQDDDDDDVSTLTANNEICSILGTPENTHRNKKPREDVPLLPCRFLALRQPCAQLQSAPSVALQNSTLPRSISGTSTVSRNVSVSRADVDFCFEVTMPCSPKENVAAVDDATLTAMETFNHSNMVAIGSDLVYNCEYF